MQICHVGVVSRYLVKLINVTVNVFYHQCQTSVSGCHSDDDFCIGQEERLFIEAEPKLCNIQVLQLISPKYTSVTSVQ